MVEQKYNVQIDEMDRIEWRKKLNREADFYEYHVQACT